MRDVCSFVAKLLNFRECCTCVLGNVVQEEGVLGEPLHLGGNDVLQLQAPAQRVTLSVLHESEGGIDPGY